MIDTKNNRRWKIAGIVTAVLVILCGIGALVSDPEPKKVLIVVTTTSLQKETATTVAITTEPEATTTVAPTTVPITTIPPTTQLRALQSDPQFDTCEEAINNGYGPYVNGIDYEYSWYRDGDGDGIVCEG